MVDIGTQNVYNIRVARRCRKREEVANAIGVSKSAIAMYEAGERVPRDPLKLKIANYYNKTVEEIFFAE